MKCGRLACGFFSLFAAGVAYGVTDAWVDPARVLVVYDTYDRYDKDRDLDGIHDSEAAAWYYVLRRGVPEGNLLALNCPYVSYDARYWYGSDEWMEFWGDIAYPIQQKLNLLGPDTIDYIVLCYGVPYVLEVDLTGTDFNVSVASTIADVFNLGDAIAPASDFDPGFPNPFFLNADPTTSPGPHFSHAGALADKYLVTSLEGADPAATFDLVEGCLYGDAYVRNLAGSYRGKVYIEQDSGNSPASPYPSTAADDWSKANENMNVLRTWMDGFWPYDCETGQGVIGGTGDFDNPLGQWHASGVSGGGPASAAPDAMFYGGFHWGGFDYNDVFGWMPGSVAAHLMDGPACDRLRVPEDTAAPPAFIAQALLRGLSGGLGRTRWSVAPGLGTFAVEEFRPEIFVYYITHGYNFAESCYASMKYMKSVDAPVGDPIYCPLYAAKTPQDDTTALAPLVMVGDGPQTSSKMISIYAGTMTSAAPTELYRFRLDVGATQDSLDTVFDYDDCLRYSIYHRYIVTQLADGTPLQPGEVYWYTVHARDPSGNEWSSPISAFATEGDISGANITKETLSTGTGDVLDCWIRDGDLIGQFRQMDPMYLSEYDEDKAVYRFSNLPAIPNDALIIKAALSVYWNFRYSGNTVPTRVSAYAFLRDWNPSEVHWLQADVGVNWARSGVSCGGIDSSTVPYTILPMERSYYPVSLPYFEGAGSYDDGDPPVGKEIDITGTVREWIAAPATNYGIMLDNIYDRWNGDSPLAIRGDQAPAAYRPELHIYWCYRPPTVTLVPDPQVSYLPPGEQQTVTLTATVTSLPADRTIDRYEWDFEGDAAVDLTVPSAALSDVRAFDYGPQEQPYRATVAVHDKDTATGEPRSVRVTSAEVIVAWPITVLITPDAALEGAGVLAGAGTVSVPAPMSADFAVDLASGDTSEATVPSAVTIPAGESLAAFDVTIVDDDLLDGDEQVTITASAASCVPGSDTILVQDDDDQDGDGLPDDWEVEHFGSTGACDPSGNADGDGLTNMDEFLAGTDPLNRDTDGDGFGDGWDPLPLRPAARGWFGGGCGSGAGVGPSCLALLAFALARRRKSRGA